MGNLTKTACNTQGPRQLHPGRLFLWSHTTQMRAHQKVLVVLKLPEQLKEMFSPNSSFGKVLGPPQLKKDREGVQCRAAKMNEEVEHLH